MKDKDYEAASAYVLKQKKLFEELRDFAKGQRLGADLTLKQLIEEGRRH